MSLLSSAAVGPETQMEAEIDGFDHDVIASSLVEVGAVTLPALLSDDELKMMATASELKKIDLTRLTPLEALNQIAKWQQSLS